MERDFEGGAAGNGAVQREPGLQRQAVEASGPVLVHISNSQLRQLVGDVCELAGVRVERAGSGHDTSKAPSNGSGRLLVVEAGLDEPPGMEAASRVCVALSEEAAADLVLPADGPLLVSIIADWAGRSLEWAILVGTWHGGGGATTTALRLAAVAGATRSGDSPGRGAVVMDAAGNTGFPLIDATEALCWEDLAPQDLPAGAALVSGLPRLRIAGAFRSVPVFTKRVGPSIRADDPLLSAALAVVPRACVVDCGNDSAGLVHLWDRLVSDGLEVKVVLVGRARDRHAETAARVLAALTADLQPEGLQGQGSRLTILTRGPVSPLFRLVQQRFGVRSNRVPRLNSIRGWRRLARTL